MLRMTGPAERYEMLIQTAFRHAEHDLRNSRTSGLHMTLDKVDPKWAWQAYEPSERQPWDRRLAAHLYRRAAFAGNAKQLDAAVQQSASAVVEQLVHGLGNAATQSSSDDLARTVLATGDPKQLAAWWTYVLIHTDHPLLERMTLVWHGHFATGAEKVTDLSLMLEQNRLLRRHALGDWRALVHGIARDPAMLIYLDSATNRKAHPNENFARELMELFCLGEGNYSEKDVQELARCFTGWEIKLGQFRFNRFQHDGGTKTILGKSGPFADSESVDWILEQPHAARFVVGKLFQQFICDEPTPTPALLEPLAENLRKNNWQLAPIVQQMLSSRLFFSEHAIARKIRSPVDLAIGILRAFEGSTNTQQLAADLHQTGQGLFFPPNVKGWDGGRSWINSSTILGRANMVRRLLEDEKTRFGAVQLDEYFSRLGANQPDEVMARVSELLLAVPLASAARESLLNLFRKSDKPIVEMIHALATLPEFQLG